MSQSDENQKGVSPLPTSRLSTLTDGVFAIVMTLLAFDVVDAAAGVTSFETLVSEIGPKLFAYALSFTILGLFWNAHHIAFHYTERTDRAHLWLGIVFLLFVALIPVPAELLGEWPISRLAVVVYGVTLALSALSFDLQWAYATRGRRLTSATLPASVVHALHQRLWVALASYALGVVVGLWSPPLGVTLFVLSHVSLALTPVAPAERS